MSGQTILVTVTTNGGQQTFRIDEDEVLQMQPDVVKDAKSISISARVQDKATPDVLEHKLIYALTQFEKPGHRRWARTIEAIKKAFVDAGWFHPVDAELIQQIVNMRAENDYDPALIIPHPHYTPQQLKAISEEWSKPRMSGQEWYDKFAAELWHPPEQELNSNDDESRTRFYRVGGQLFMYGRAIDAAKKAAGIE